MYCVFAAFCQHFNKAYADDDDDDDDDCNRSIGLHH